jgi:bacteriocin leader peptide (microcyclamide/patellamide family)
MNNKSITPSVQQPVNRVASGQLPSALAELSEAALTGSDVVASSPSLCCCACSFDGDE